jgi:hypothetical protein
LQPAYALPRAWQQQGRPSTHASSVSIAPWHPLSPNPARVDAWMHETRSNTEEGIRGDARAPPCAPPRAPESHVRRGMAAALSAAESERLVKGLEQRCVRVGNLVVSTLSHPACPLRVAGVGGLQSTRIEPCFTSEYPVSHSWVEGRKMTSRRVCREQTRGVPSRSVVTRVFRAR